MTLPPAELLIALRRQAQAESDAHKMIANAKSARQADRDDYPELSATGYGWIKPEQTVSWKAADTIERLEARVGELEKALVPFARAYRALGVDPGPLRIYTDTGYREMLLEDFRKAANFLATKGAGDE